MKLNPQDCLVVEDAKAGLLAARAAGMDCAVLGDAAKSDLAAEQTDHSANAQEHAAVYRLSSFCDILKVLEETNVSQ